VEEQGPYNSLGKCLTDISEYYSSGIEGYDALYHLVLEKINEEVENQGVVDEETMLSANEIIGGKLYEIVKINNAYSSKDQKIYEQMLKHRFITLKLLELPQYAE
jgi:PBP1b-binding outer membrane lipoprotein LpoB